MEQPPVAEYQRIIDEIRFQLQSSDCELTDELRQLASAYSAACREVNQRLRRCGEFLRLGLRSEAIQFAEAEPNLLDLVTRLDFPKREAWEELVTMYQLPRMEPLLLDMAEMLNEAYAEQEPLEKLLSTHRLMALAKSPLEQRLGILRKLADLDLQATFWDDDLRDMEKARLHEIKVEASAAASRGNHERLNQLLAQVQQSSWRNPPPPSFVKSIAQMTGEASQNWAKLELIRLEQELNDAFSALDFTSAQRLRDRWNEVAAQADLSLEDPLWKRNAPVLEWVEDEEKQQAKEQAYRLAVGRLELALENDRLDLPELERLGHDIRKFNQEIPEPLATRFRNRVASLQFADTRRRNLIIAGAALSVLLVIGSVGFLIQRQFRASEVRAVAVAVNQMIDDGQLADARTLVEKHADFPVHEAWLNVQRKLGDAERVEQDRAREVQTLISSAESTESYNQAVQLLNQAREVARISEEKLAIGRLEMEWDERNRKEIASREEAFRSLVEQVSSKLQEADQALVRVDPVDQRTLQDLRRVETQLDLAGQTLIELRRAAGMVRSALNSQVALLESRLEATRETYDQKSQRVVLLAQMLNKAMVTPEDQHFDGKLKAYQEAMETYVAAFPKDARSSDFEKLTAQSVAWESVLKWQQLWRGWEIIPTVDLSDAVAQIEACEQFLTEYSDTPSAPIAQQYLTYVESIRQREQSANGDTLDGAKARIAKLFENKLLSKIYLLELKDGTKYYLSEPLEKDYTNAPDSEVVNFHPVTDYYGALGSGSKGSGKIKRVEELKTRKATLAPHALIGSRVKETIRNCSISEWDAYCLGLCRRILSDPEMDEFLKYFLLLRVAELAGEGNAHLKVALVPVLKKFQNDKIDLAVNWMDPANRSAHQAREMAMEALGNIVPEDFERAWENAKTQTENLVKQVRSPILAVGSLVKTQDGDWQCMTTWKPASDYKLQIVVPGGSGQTWASVGKVQGNSVTLNGNLSAPEAIEGQLIFAFPTDSADLAFVRPHVREN